jgi:outer membrane receptor for ferrienterochelin and colicin
MNNDGFMDNPLAKQVNVMNRYQYYNAEKGLVSFINFRYMNDKKLSGQTDFDKDRDKLTTHFWGSEINTERLDIATRVGYIFKDMPFQSIGFQNAFNTHNQSSYFGLNQYNINQKSVYSNLIFNSIINNTMHKFATGLNFTFDKYQEGVAVSNFSNDFNRIDNSIGAFFEYTYDNTTNFSVILGGRIDNHNRLGTFVTPRVHLRYNAWTKGIWRASIGRGKRMANIFAENQSLLASNRSFEILNTNGNAYGLNPEIAWNYGVSFNQKFTIFGKSADAGFDLYRTDFQSQVVVDLYQSAQQVLFYNLIGKSFANSLQVDFNIELIKHLDLRAAYKFYDIQTDFISGTSERPLQAKHRFFANIGFETHKQKNAGQWKFDFTYNWTGEQKLPNTKIPLSHDHFDAYSPAYSLLNAQITKVFSSVFEIYIGAENVGNYTQHNAILGAENPFGTRFDASIVYAPIFGQMYYGGLRYKIK